MLHNRSPRNTNGLRLLPPITAASAVIPKYGQESVKTAQTTEFAWLLQHGIEAPRVVLRLLHGERTKRHALSRVTNDLVRRVNQHKTKALGGFTAQYGVNQLIWYECYDDAITAIAREKELKKWHRAWKLIEKVNPDWTDLYDGICG